MSFQHSYMYAQETTYKAEVFTVALFLIVKKYILLIH